MRERAETKKQHVRPWRERRNKKGRQTSRSESGRSRVGPERRDLLENL